MSLILPDPSARGIHNQLPPPVALGLHFPGEAQMPDVLSCRVTSADWRPGRVYFLTLLEPLTGTTGLWPLPAGRPVPATVGQLSTAVDWFTAHAADRAAYLAVEDCDQRAALGGKLPDWEILGRGFGWGRLVVELDDL